VQTRYVSGSIVTGGIYLPNGGGSIKCVTSYRADYLTPRAGSNCS
jgi:hypothetical protein